MKRIIAMIAMLAFMLVGMSAITSPASAHAATIAGSSTCSNKGWNATFVVTNDAHNGKATLSGTNTGLDGKYNQGANKSITLHMDNADASASVSNGTMVWEDDFTQNNIAKTVNNPGECAPQHVPVNVCHATSSDTNPYVFLTVDDDSTKFEGHLSHRNDPNKTWKSAGFFDGIYHEAGAPKPDLIQSYTDTDGVFHDLDGDITEAVCDGQVVPPTCENHPTDSTCPQPAAVHSSTSETVKDCATKTVTTTVHNYTTAYVWNNESGTWVLGDEVEDGDSPHVNVVETTDEDCPVVTPLKDADAGIAWTPATCDAPATAGVQPLVHATLDSPPLDETVGDHVANFTADEGHLFADGTNTFSESYTIDGPDQSLCPVTTPGPTPPGLALATVEVTAPTCDVKGKAFVNATNALLLGKLRQGIGTHVAHFGAFRHYLFDNGTVFKNVKYTIAPKKTCDSVPPAPNNPPKHNAPPTTTLTKLPNAGLNNSSTNYMPYGIAGLLILSGVALLTRRRRA